MHAGFSPTCLINACADPDLEELGGGGGDGGYQTHVKLFKICLEPPSPQTQSALGHPLPRHWKNVLDPCMKLYIHMCS